jgi:hypothetical protein
MRALSLALLIVIATPAAARFEIGRADPPPAPVVATAPGKSPADVAAQAAAGAAPGRALQFDSAAALEERRSGWRLAWSGPVSVTLFNPGDQPARLRVAADDFRRMAGDAALPAAGALTLGGFAAGPDCPRDPGGALMLAPLARCRLTFTPVVDRPGDYRVRLSVAGDGVAESAELRLLAGRGWGAAVLALLVGGLIGGVLAFLRGPFATRAAAYADAVRLRDRRDALAALARRAMPVEGRDGPFLRDHVGRHVGEVYHGRAGAADIADRLQLLEQLVWHAQRADKLEAARREALSGPFAATVTDLESPDLARAKESVAALAQAVEKALAEQRDTARAGGRNFESALAGTTIDAPYVAIFPPTIGAAALARLLVRGELVAAILVFTLFMLVALLELWDGRAAWGSFRDLVIAILAGAGVFGGSAALVQGLRQNARSL